MESGLGPAQMMPMILRPGRSLSASNRRCADAVKSVVKNGAIFFEHDFGVAVSFLQGRLESLDAVVAECVVLCQHADRDIALAERDCGGERILGGIAAGAENVAIPFVAGDGVGDRGLDQQHFLRILGDRQHGERRARGGRADGEIDVIVGVGLLEQRLRHVRFALIVLGSTTILRPSSIMVPLVRYSRPIMRPASVCLA